MIGLVTVQTMDQAHGAHRCWPIILRVENEKGCGCGFFRLIPSKPAQIAAFVATSHSQVTPRFVASACFSTEGNPQLDDEGQEFRPGALNELFGDPLKP